MGTPMFKPQQPSGIEIRQANGNGTNTPASNRPQSRISTNRQQQAESSPMTNRSSNSISNHIDKAIAKQKKDDLSRLKILLLGGADAGKSTIVKQMRILHMSGFTADEIHSFQKYLRYNLFQIFHEMAHGILRLGIKVSEFEEELVARFAQNLSWIIEIDVETELEVLRMFSQFECVNIFSEGHSNWPSLPDNTHYFLPHLNRILDRHFIPNEADILHLRIPTSNISEINFNFSTCTIRLIDVGGQRTYRKKWIHCFEGVAAVLFVASMAAYDQALEDVDFSVKPILYKNLFSPQPVQKHTSRLRDSAHLFGEMLRNQFLKSSAFILFLNKKDLFEKKLSVSPIQNFVTGYDKPNEYEPAAEFLKEYFLKRKSKRDRDRKIYSHFTCATDTQNVDFVFKATCDIVLQKNLNSSGIQ